MAIRTCFCTGVLPVTMDDLTSGYNIAEILTLEPEFLSMLGFTYKEAEVYLRYVLDTYTEGQDRFDDVWQLIVNNYDGYRFLPEAEPLFNSTILTYFFKKFAVRKGGIPSELVDENLRTDIGWIRHLTLSLENAKEMQDALVIDDELSYNVSDLSSKFNKRKFFDKSIYPVSLFYLGMTTLRSNYRMVLPNLTMRSIYMDYYNEMNHIEGNAQRYVPTYERFTEERRFEPLVQNYFEQYLGQFPAQVFDKINENFIRCSFFELCSRYLSSCYTFAGGTFRFRDDRYPRHGLLQGRPVGGIQVFQSERSGAHAGAQRSPSRGRGASTRLRQGYQGEVPTLSCPFLHCIYLCQQRMEMLGGDSVISF